MDFFPFLILNKNKSFKLEKKTKILQFTYLKIYILMLFNYLLYYIKNV